jgi:hypothetical protein
MGGVRETGCCRSINSTRNSYVNSCGIASRLSSCTHEAEPVFGGLGIWRVRCRYSGSRLWDGRLREEMFFRHCVCTVCRRDSPGRQDVRRPPKRRGCRGCHALGPSNLPYVELWVQQRWEHCCCPTQPARCWRAGVTSDGRRYVEGGIISAGSSSE